MATRKNLGMGLDVLLAPTGNQASRSFGIELREVLDKARATYERALGEDEKGHIFEAYHLYRQVVDTTEHLLPSPSPEISRLVSQALNNAAIILYENYSTAAARHLLTKAIEVCPDNNTARDNLTLLAEREVER